ncbi:MAG: FprA family A-type flavoprotein [Deltaproteobacteria bacterium]|nr:FprA family A-type flavoprotein [Deltaproteobacteria bacterium]
MKPFELKKNFFWVGAIDWAVRDFHGYETPRGTTYNNYLILDKEITLIDTVKYDFSAITVNHIKSLVDPSQIKHVVINHIENDHATSIDDIMALCPDAVIHITERGKKGLDRFFDTSRWKFHIVKTGDTLNIGKNTLMFIETPMLHWPDSMMTWCQETGILFSQDGFGQHLASSARFDDEFSKCVSAVVLDDAVVDYYANILMPFGQLILDAISNLKKLGIEPKIIAPDHGVIWRANPQKVLDSYIAMASGKADLRAIIVYDTMWHSTEKMTVPISEGIRDAGVDCRVLKLRATPMNVIIKEFWKARGTLFGTPTLNNIMYPTVAECLTHLRGLRPKNRMAGAFGSYGWGGGAVKESYETFTKMGLELFEPGMQVIYKPSTEDEAKCYQFGQDFAAKLKAYHERF